MITVAGATEVLHRAVVEVVRHHLRVGRAAVAPVVAVDAAPHRVAAGQLRA